MAAVAKGKRRSEELERGGSVSVGAVVGRCRWVGWISEMTTEWDGFLKQLGFFLMLYTARLTPQAEMGLVGCNTLVC